MTDPSFLQIIAILTVIVIAILLIFSRPGKRLDKSEKYTESYAKEKENETGMKKKMQWRSGLALGMSFGLIIGIMIDNIALGIALGSCPWNGFGSGFMEKMKREYVKNK